MNVLSHSEREQCKYTNIVAFLKTRDRSGPELHIGARMCTDSGESTDGMFINDIVSLLDEISL